MTGSTLTDALTPASTLSPWAPALQPSAASADLWSPGMALLRGLGLRRRWLLPALLALLPALLVAAAWLHGERLGVAALDERLQGVADGETLLSAAIDLRDSGDDSVAAPAAQAGGERQQRLAALLQRLHSGAGSQGALARDAGVLQQRVVELNRVVAAASPPGKGWPAEGADSLSRDLDALRLELQQGLALQHDADLRVRDLAVATAEALPALAASLQASLRTVRAALPDGMPRRELARGLVEQRTAVVLALERAREPLRRSVAAHSLDGAQVSATLAQIEQQLSAMDRIAHAAMGDAAIGPAAAQDYVRQTQRTLRAAAQLESQGLAALREPLQARRAALAQRGGLLAAALGVWLLAVCYLLACAGRLLGASLRALADDAAALRTPGDAHEAFTAPRGDELEQARRLLADAAARLQRHRGELSSSGAAVARDAQAVVAGQGALLLRAGEVRGACAEVAGRFAALGAMFDDCAHSAEAAVVEAQAMADETRHGRRAQAGLRARLLASSGSSREIGHVLQQIENVARQTRLLALNALVEAERCGAAGKGFVVVVQELRALAQRNEQAATALQPLVGAVTTGIDDCHQASEIASQAGQDTEQRLDAAQRAIADLARRAEHGGVETRQMQQSAQRVEGGLDDMVAGLEQLSQALAALRGQGRALQAAVQAVAAG